MQREERRLGGSPSDAVAEPSSKPASQVIKQPSALRTRAVSLRSVKGLGSGVALGLSSEMCGLAAPGPDPVAAGF